MIFISTFWFEGIVCTKLITYNIGMKFKLTEVKHKLWPINNKVIIIKQNNNLTDNGNFMVSFMLNVVKFLLIYRHLQNIYWFKRGIVLLPIPHIEALALPILVEQTTLEPTPIWKSLPQRDLYNTFDCAQKGTIYAYKVSTGFWYNHTRDIYRC